MEFGGTYRFQHKLQVGLVHHLFQDLQGIDLAEMNEMQLGACPEPVVLSTELIFGKLANKVNLKSIYLQAAIKT